MSILEWARVAIGIDSTTEHGTTDIAEYFSKIAQGAGLKAEVIHDNFRGIHQATVRVCKADNNFDAKKIVVSAIDTTNVGEGARWTKTGGNPFSASVDGDSLIGIGAAQGKIAFLAQIAALANAKDSDWSLVGTYGRELGYGLLKLYRKKILRPTFAMITHPTSMQIATRAAGFASVEVRIPFSPEEKAEQDRAQEVENSILHSKMFSAPESTALDYLDNPIVKMMEYLRHLPQGALIISADGGSADSLIPEAVWLDLDVGASVNSSCKEKLLRLNEALLDFSRELRKIKASEFVPAHSTFNVGRIRTIRDGINMSGVCRLVPTETRDIYQNWLSNLKERAKEFGADVELLEFREPHLISSTSPLPQGIVKLTSLPLSSNATDCTSANLIARFGVSSVVFGPGQGVGGSLGANESISISDLMSAANIYQKIFEGLKL